MEKQTYSDLLKDPRWIHKREDILYRDNYKCVPCTKKADDLPALGNHLHVHHIAYRKGLAPWEYNDNELITLCDDCHKIITEKIISCNDLIRHICLDGDIAEQLEFLLISISKMDNPWKIRDLAKKLLYLE